MFLCRERELTELNRRFEADGFECIVIYGRRRVGKTALIREFCKDKRAVFFSALFEGTEQDNLKMLSEAIFACKEPGRTGGPVFASFNEAFREISHMSETEGLVFVIDEYPYLARSRKSISSELQHIIDHVWQERKLTLILCGSSVSFMEDEVLGSKSPLFGRRTGQIKLLPLNYEETALFCPKLSLEEKALLYGITGGVPHYINRLGATNSIKEALISNFFDTAAYLFEEPSNLLKQELREPAAYNSIIAAIAGGASRLSEISTRTGLDSAQCSKHLSVLMGLGIVKKEVPFGEKGNGKKTLYTICDPLFRFWYRFVPANTNAISMGYMDKVYDIAVGERLHDDMGLVFEDMCKDYLRRYGYGDGRYAGDIGQWWGSDKESRSEVQIDIVADTQVKGEYIIGSCKFRNEPVGLDELNLLKRYAKAFRSEGRYIYYIFSLAGFKRELLQESEKDERLRLVSLKEMYAPCP